VIEDVGGSIAAVADRGKILTRGTQSNLLFVNVSVYVLAQRPDVRP
jgi:hypothetical protein